MPAGSTAFASPGRPGGFSRKGDDRDRADAGATSYGFQNGLLVSSATSQRVRLVSR